MEDTLLEYKGVSAMGSANHFQFVGYREVLKQGLPESWDQRLMGDMVEFDGRLDQLGYLRLSTPGRFVRHIGNTINEELSQEAEALGLNSNRHFRSALYQEALDFVPAAQPQDIKNDLQLVVQSIVPA